VPKAKRRSNERTGKVRTVDIGLRWAAKDRLPEKIQKSAKKASLYPACL
jgi:hypothetical protein